MQEHKMVTRLPIIEYKGKKYFVDARLREFRTNSKPFDPIEFIPFDSKKGRIMIKAILESGGNQIEGSDLC